MDTTNLRSGSDVAGASKPVPMERYLVLTSEAANLCGVEAFTRHMAAHLGKRADTLAMTANVGRLNKALEKCDGVILNFPIVAWKKRLVEPVIVALLAKLRRKRLTVVLHEWASLDWKRRLVLLPVVKLADAILFSAPEIRDEWSRSHSASRSKKIALIPIPPNLLPSPIESDVPAATAIRGLRQDGRKIIGQFGSIYPKKNCAELLSIAAELRKAGQDVAVAFIGSFIKATDNVEDEFHAQVRAHGLEDRVLVTGYIAEDSHVFAALRELDVVCYKFTEGLTSRRGSVLAAALSGRCVVTNGPREMSSLSHHGLFNAMIANGNIRLTATDADSSAMAGEVGRAFQCLPGTLDFERELDMLWKTIIDRLDAVHAGESAPSRYK
ncbi:glycosyltransferase involved in cell wall biosynthesis [Mycoplana sp. BE70]|uniref:glycosyltransferase n=1 Tax=Mycoplana sp. BE70 TaxID=2817775 RepID=UPI0028673B4D|nr:glycosyltransferase [Mycoplana sp. BE70]MDR6756902.1 glycosyltransferase involved in cell wall biosynthesis [Mycoplana sp. BE70]